MVKSIIVLLTLPIKRFTRLKTEVLLEIFNTIMFAVIAVGALSTAYVLRNRLNQVITGLEAMNERLSAIEEKLDSLDHKKT